MDAGVTGHVRSGAAARQRRGWIMVFAPKGGMGKTTTATNLVVSAARAGRKALAVDFDAQKSLSTWGHKRGLRRDRDELASFAIFEGDLAKRDDAYRIAESYDVVVFDTPPGVEADTGAKLLSLATRCDFVIIPVTVSVADIEKVRVFGREVLAKNGVPYAFYFSKVSKVHDTPRDVENCVRALKGYGPILDVVVAQRAEIKRMMETGICSSDHEQQPGYADFASLWSTVSEKVLP